jgi:hypothetical protein
MKILIHNLQLDVVLTDFCLIRITSAHEKVMNLDAGKSMENRVTE